MLTRGGMESIMSEHPINGLMNVTLEKIKAMVDANTVVGEPITTAEGTLIIPVSKISFGFASGGSDFPSKTPKEMFGGGGGAGMNITPVGFLVIQNGNVKLLQLANNNNAVDRAVGMMPEMVDKITALFNKNNKEKIDTTINQVSE